VHRVGSEPVRVGVDATPLLGQRSGVGRYLEGLLEGLASAPDAPEVLLTLFSIRGRVPPPLPAGTTLAPRRAPARLLNRAWAVAPFPPVELLTGRVDVFHGSNFVLPPLARAGGTVTVHDLTYLRYPDTVDDQVRAYRELVPRALRRAARVLTVSHAIADELVDEYRLAPDQVVVAPLGVSPTWAHAAPLDAAGRARLGVPDRYLLFAGNLEPRKDLGTLVRAHRAARRADPDTPQLVVVGPAGWGDAWGPSGPPDRSDVVLLGFVPDADLRALLAGARALCSPSRYEGFGLPVLESLAAGTPVLASDIPAHREVADGHARLLPVGDVDAWAGALGDDDLPDAEAVDAGRRHAATHTWRRCADRHLEAWRSAARRT